MFDYYSKLGQPCSAIKAAFRFTRAVAASPDDSLGLDKESLVFARKVSVRLKSDAAGPFIQKMEDEIIPLLRKQKGFLDELILIPRAEKKFTPIVSGKTAKMPSGTTGLR